MRPCCIAIILIVVLCASTTRSQTLVERQIDVPTQFRSLFDTSRTLRLDDRLDITLYYIGSLSRPRFLGQDPNGLICVADMDGGHIMRLLDINHDGIADTAVAITPLVDSAHSFAFYHGALYVAEPSRVRKFLDTDGDGYFETEEPFITGIGSTGPYNHYTRTILIDSIAGYIYLSVGAPCNVCREEDTDRATVLRFSLDGSGKEIYASGLRNALGIAKAPDGNIWIANADRDGLSDSTPDEIVTHLEPYGFYGWPFAYDNKQWDNFSANADYQGMLPITAHDSSLVATMPTPDLMLPAHSTPMQLVADYNDSDTLLDGAGFYLAVHGSSAGGRSSGIGYNLIHIQYNDTAEHWEYHDMLDGFLTDPANYTYWARPCGLTYDRQRHSLYLGSDVGTKAIFKITPHLRSNVEEQHSTDDLRVFPNPAEHTITLSLPNGSTANGMTIYDMLGRVVSYQPVSEHTENGHTLQTIILDPRLHNEVIVIRIQGKNGSEAASVVVR